MARFTLDSLFSPWTLATVKPARKGWYRIRTERLPRSWWNGMAYWDGSVWLEFGRYALGSACLEVRREIKVFQWQGLRMPVAAAISLTRQNMPCSPKAKREWTRFLHQTLGATELVA